MPGPEILPEIDSADAEMAGERARARIFLSMMACCCATCALAFFRLAASVSSVAWLTACILNCFWSRSIGDLVQIGHRLQRVEPRDVVGGAQLEKRRAFLDVVAGIERDRLDHAGNFQRQIGALHRAQRADRLDVRSAIRS